MTGWRMIGGVGRNLTLGSFERPRQVCWGMDLVEQMDTP